MTSPIVLKPKGFWHALLTEQGYAQKTMLVGIRVAMTKTRRANR